MHDLKKDIHKVYKNTIDPHADLHAKLTLDILTVIFIFSIYFTQDIEINLENYVKEINFIEADNLNEVIKEEKNLKGIYKFE